VEGAIAGEPGRPLGEPLPDWKPAAHPGRGELRGRYVLLRPVDPLADAEPLFSVSRDPEIWAYLFDGPYADVAGFRAMLAGVADLDDPFRYTLVPLASGRPEGMASYLRIEPHSGTIEIGNIWFGTPMQRTTAATEAIYLLASNAFDTLGYRRLEWKCIALNAPSRRAAERFGFTFEGVFEQHMVVKGRNRDTAWYAITDRRWPAVRAAFEAWLDPSNFDEEGRQRRGLGARQFATA
jgi:RimJ/RimL family protein N-acetyltransferase